MRDEPAEIVASMFGSMAAAGAWALGLSMIVFVSFFIYFGFFL